MKIEVRADNTVKITGYVNAVERESRPVITPRGKVNEIIEQRTFERALERAGNIPMTADHDTKTLAQTADGTLRLYEDAIGLRAEAEFADEDVAQAAREKKIKGWSFGMRNVRDELEERSAGLPLRRIKSLDLDHVTLVINKTPCYSATSVELRAEGETEVEARTLADRVEITTEEEKPKIDYADYETRINQLKAAK